MKEKEQDKELLTEEEKILAQGANTKFWQTLKIHFDKCIEELDDFNSEAMGQGASLEDIGRNTIVINLTKGVLRRVINKVTDSKEAIEANEK